MDTNAKTILVVEDDLPLLAVIANRLEKAGFNVITASSVDQAMKIDAEWKKIDAIWLDHYLPNGKTGLDFIAYLYKSGMGEKTKVPIFVVTNSEDVQQEKKYRESGQVIEYFVKTNFRLDDIISQVKEHFSRVAMEKHLTS